MDQLNLTHRYGDDFTKSEREIVMRRANKAVDRVIAVYEQGEHRALNKEYRAARLAGALKMTFSKFKEQHMVRMIRAVADVQRKQERRGLEI